MQLISNTDKFLLSIYNNHKILIRLTLKQTFTQLKSKVPYKVYNFRLIKHKIGSGSNLHVLSAYWSMIILAIHIGFHWDMLMAIARKIFRLSPPQIFRTYLLRLLSVIIAIYGLVATVKLEIGAKLIAYYSFSFYDESQSYWWLLLDYFAFCGLCTALTHYGVKLLRNLQKNNSSRNNITI